MIFLRTICAPPFGLTLWNLFLVFFYATQFWGHSVDPLQCYISEFVFSSTFREATQLDFFSPPFGLQIKQFCLPFSMSLSSHPYNYRALVWILLAIWLTSKPSVFTSLLVSDNALYNHFNFRCISSISAFKSAFLNILLHLFSKFNQ